MYKYIFTILVKKKLILLPLCLNKVYYYYYYYYYVIANNFKKQFTIRPIRTRIEAKLMNELYSVAKEVRYYRCVLIGQNLPFIVLINSFLNHASITRRMMKLKRK